MIFKLPTLFSLGLISLLAIFFIHSHTAINGSDQKFYKKLGVKTKTLCSSKSLERHPTQQMRKGTQKDIWTEERAHFQIIASDATLSLSQKKGKIFAMEELQNIICLDPSAKMRAKDGVFNYPGNRFTANSVECSHQLGELNAGKAIFQSLPTNTLTLENEVHLKNPSFSIHSQTATTQGKTITFLSQVEVQMRGDVSALGDTALYTEDSFVLYGTPVRGSAHIEGEKNLRFSAEELLWHEGAIELKNKIQIDQGEKVSIQADSAYLTLDENNQPILAKLQDNVRLFSPHIQGKDTFAVADTVLLKDQTITLSAVEPKRVLLWQEGVSLSAPEIFIEKDTIVGRGDVHFTFTMEEQTIIDQFISKYI